MAADTSPVYAPSSSQWTFCAYTVIPPATASRRDVKGGQMTTSTPGGGSNAAQKASVSEGVLYIFQLPAISTSRLRDHRDAGELLALEKLERGAAPRRNPVDPLGQAELLDGADRVAAAD